MGATTSPRCKHFGECGGCAFQDREYPGEQLSMKRRILNGLFGGEVEILPSPKPYEYRNRMDFVCAFGRIGLRKRGRFREVVEIERCRLLPARAAELFTRLKETSRRENIPDFNYLNHQGYLRYITIRVAEFTEDIMVNFVTATDEDRLLPLVEAARREACSVNWIVQGGAADVNFGPVKKCFGRSFFTEKAGGCRYRAGPNTFTQNNASLTPALLEYVKSNVQGRILDLYCGMGTFSLYVADRAKEVLGVELEGESICFAHENLALNQIQNVHFIAGDVRKWLIENEKKEWFHTIIADPPRSGLGGKIARKILRMAPQRLIVVSCNPKMLEEDLRTFKDAYWLEAIRGFDMFPQTPHMEVVGVLERRGI